jgi:DNA polymerase
MRNLQTLRDEWVGCRKCDLGVYRQEMDGEFVFGEGYTRGIMFIGEGPTKEDDRSGTPFSGKTGNIIRTVAKKLGIPAYFTNLVSCRSCTQAHTSEGQPIFYANRRTGVQEPKINDVPPVQTQIEACLPRLYEEIYLVDPHIIVAMGEVTCNALATGGVIKLPRDQGKQRLEISIPGKAYTPVLTEKKHVWERKVHGVLSLPTALNTIQYKMIPTVNMQWLASHWRDRSPGSAIEMFVKDMRLVRDIYNRRAYEADGIHPEERATLIEDDIIEEILTDG